MQVPGREIAVEERTIELLGRELLEDIGAGPKANHGMLVFRQCDRPGDDADTLAHQIGQGTNVPGILRHHQAKLTPSVGDAPGDVLGRSLVLGMAKDDIAVLVAQAAPGAGGIGTPVSLEGTAKLPANQPGDGNVEALRGAIEILPGARHGGGLSTENQGLWLVFSLGISIAGREDEDECERSNDVLKQSCPTR